MCAVAVDATNVYAYAACVQMCAVAVDPIILCMHMLRVL